MNMFDKIADSIQEWYGSEDRIYEEDNGFVIGAIINIQYPPTPYFRLYYGEHNYRDISSAKMCRISLLEPKYLNLEGEDLILNKEQKIRLIEILNSPCPGCEEIRVWDQILGHYNFFHKDNIDFNGLNVQFEPISYDLQIPDYTKLSGGE